MRIRSKCLNKGDTHLTWLMIGGVIWVNKVFCRGFRQNTFFAMIWSLVSLLLHSAVVHPLCEFDVVYMVCILLGLTCKPVLFKATWTHCLTRRHTLLFSLAMMQMVIWMIQIKRLISTSYPHLVAHISISFRLRSKWKEGKSSVEFNEI